MTITTIEYKNNFTYYLAISVSVVNVLISGLIAVLCLIESEDGGVVFLISGVWMFLKLLDFKRLLKFKKIVIGNNITKINSNDYKTSDLTFKYPRTFWWYGLIPPSYCKIYQNDDHVFTYLHSSFFLGNITQTDPDKILEIIERIKKGEIIKEKVLFDDIDKFQIIDIILLMLLATPVIIFL